MRKRKPKDQKKVPMKLMIDPGLLEAVRRTALKNSASMNRVIRDCVKKCIADNQP